MDWLFDSDVLGITLLMIVFGLFFLGAMLLIAHQMGNSDTHLEIERSKTQASPPSRFTNGVLRTPQPSPGAAGAYRSPARPSEAAGRQGAPTRSYMKVDEGQLVVPADWPQRYSK